MKRLLPVWMIEQADNVERKRSGPQRCEVPAERFPRRVMYVLSPDELLATARLALTQHEEETRIANTTEEELAVQLPRHVSDPADVVRNTHQTNSDAAETKLTSPVMCSLIESSGSENSSFTSSGSNVRSDMSCEQQQDAGARYRRTNDDCTQTFDYLSSIFFGDDSG